VPAEAVAGICPCVDLAAYDATAPAREADAAPDPKAKKADAEPAPRPLFKQVSVSIWTIGFHFFLYSYGKP
jgi:hypothetical protein